MLLASVNDIQFLISTFINVFYETIFSLFYRVGNSIVIWISIYLNFDGSHWRYHFHF